jgi:hypothetical protein
MQDAHMPLRLLASLLVAAVWSFPLYAQPVDAARLIETLRVADTIAVMELEGLAHGNDLEEELFPGVGGARWDRIVALIYDRPTMQQRFGSAFARRIGTDAETLGQIDAFFASELGQRILGLELEARRALLDSTVEQAAEAAVDRMRSDHDPRLVLLERFAEANDLIEENVSGALNANLAFYRGMSEGGAFSGAEMTEDEMLSEVWSQEADIRAETEGWLYPYLLLSYAPLPDADLQAYIDFSQSQAGQTANRAMFGAFDDLFTTISHDLGRAAAEMLSAQDI